VLSWALRQSELCKLNEKRHQVPVAGKMWKSDYMILKRTFLRSPMTVLAHSLATMRQKYLV
jgi:hypothetical protein